MALLELRAPQHNVEVVGDRLEIAIDRRRTQRPQLFVNLRHAIGHHAEWDKVLPNVLGLQVPLVQPCDQSLGIGRQNIGASRGEEVDRIAGDGDDGWEDLLERAPNAAQEIRKVGTDGLLRRPQLQGEQSSRRQVLACGTEELNGIETVDLRGLRVGNIQNNCVEPVASRPQIVPAIRGSASGPASPRPEEQTAPGRTGAPCR